MSSTVNVMQRRLFCLLVPWIAGLLSVVSTARAEEKASAAVRIADDGFLSIDGERRFIVGMFSAGSFEQMGKAGFNATHSYSVSTDREGAPVDGKDRLIKELLDDSAANGMKIMVELPRQAIEKAQWEKVRHRIETFRHHPGLLCWGSEERVARGRAPLKNIAALYQLVHELDPDHPFVLGDTRDVIQNLQKEQRNFFPDDCMDIGIWWWYPIPLHKPDGNGLAGNEKNGDRLEPPPWLTTTLSKKPLWICIQSYEKPEKGSRFPTPTEYRCMAYLAIINNAKGLWFYTGYGQRDWQGKPAGLLNKQTEGHWDYVQTLVRELRDLEPVILAKPAEKPTMTPFNAPVEFTLRNTNGAFYLLAANKSGRTQKISFNSNAFVDKHVTVLNEKHSAELHGEILSDSFKPYAVHVYRIE